MIVLVDNYDSFSYNLYQLLGSIDPDVRVVRNDAYGVDEIAAMDSDAIVLSPGPGRPADAGVCEDVVCKLSGRVPILGVCLGHQAICEAFGASIVHAAELMHGKSSLATFDPECSLFSGVTWPMKVGRYHSLEVDEATLPACLKVASSVASGEVMAVGHVEHPTFGLQFHPESVLTPEGPILVENFVRIARAFRSSRDRP